VHKWAGSEFPGRCTFFELSWIFTEIFNLLKGLRVCLTKTALGIARSTPNY